MIDVVVKTPMSEKKFPDKWIDYGRKKRFELYSWQPTAKKAMMGRIPFNIITESIYDNETE